MLIVGICGASGSGKSTFAEEIKSSLVHDALILEQDCYYRDYSHLPFEDRKLLNYDSPNIFDFNELISDIQTLKEGGSIQKKGYDYKLYKRADSDEVIHPTDVLILEGIHTFFNDELLDMMDLKVFMHVDIDICLLRRIERDILERGRAIENISHQYLTTVKPMYEQYISKYIKLADFAVMGGGLNRRSIDAVSAYVSAKLLARILK